MVRVAVVDALLRRWTSRLHVQDWDIDLHVVLSDKLDGGEATGQLSVNAKALKAKLSVATDRELDEVEWTIIHELVHLARWGATEAYNCFIGQLSADARELARELYEVADEQATQRLADALWQVTRDGH